MMIYLHQWLHFFSQVLEQIFGFSFHQSARKYSTYINIQNEFVVFYRKNISHQYQIIQVHFFSNNISIYLKFYLKSQFSLNYKLNYLYNLYLYHFNEL